MSNAVGWIWSDFAKEGTEAAILRPLGENAGAAAWISESLAMSDDCICRKLGAILKTSQPRVAKIERAASDVSLDQLVRAFTAAGGTIEIKPAKVRGKRGQQSPSWKETLVFQVTTSK